MFADKEGGDGPGCESLLERRRRSSSNQWETMRTSVAPVALRTMKKL
jgi:hypothetical protein